MIERVGTELIDHVQRATIGVIMAERINVDRHGTTELAASTS